MTVLADTAATLRPTLDPVPERLDQLAQRLAHLRRWVGNPRALTVAEHAVHVSRRVALVVPELALAGLHHDDHEALTGDLVSPLKRFINEATEGAWDRLELGLDDELAQAPWCHGRWTSSDLRDPRVRAADLEQCEHERRALAGGSSAPLDPEAATRLYVAEHRRLEALCGA